MQRQTITRILSTCILMPMYSGFYFSINGCCQLKRPLIRFNSSLVSWRLRNNATCPAYKTVRKCVEMEYRNRSHVQSAPPDSKNIRAISTKISNLQSGYRFSSREKNKIEMIRLYLNTGGDFSTESWRQRRFMGYQQATRFLHRL